MKVYAIKLNHLPNAVRSTIRKRGAYIGVDTSALEVFQGNRRLAPARWPKVGFLRSIQRGPDDSSIVLPDELFERFGNEPSLWLGGYWTADYAFETSPVRSADRKSRTLVVEKLNAPGAIRDNFPFYFFNAFEALTQPGEYVFDEKSGTVYAAAVNGSGRFEIGVEETLLEINGAHDLHISGLVLEKTLGTALRIRNSSNVTIDGCSIRHVGGAAISVEGGANVVISHCEIEDTAETAITLEGGDRATLTPGGHVVRDSTVRSFGVGSHAYRPAVQLTGVGLRVERTVIENGPHAAIIVQGNDHVIRENKIFDVVKEGDDAGAIYMGLDWTERGNVIENNWFSNIGMTDATTAPLSVGRSFVAGVYLDDQESGFLISGNIFDRVSRPVVVHGGRDNLINNNAFLRCGQSGIWLGLRDGDKGAEVIGKRLQAMPYATPPWSIRYPALAKIQERRPNEPLDNEESGNIAIGCPLFSFRGDTSPNFWPAIGTSSRQFGDASAADTTRQVLEHAGVGCDAFPLLCR